MNDATELPRLLRSLTAEPLVIERRTLDAFVSVLRRRALEGASFSGPELHAEMDVAMPRSTRRVSGERSVEVIPIVGAIANRAASLGTSALTTARRVKAAAADPRVDAIALDIDSPGGTVTGVPELADAVFAARAEKRVVAVARGLMASAAYWVGSAADEVVVTPSSEAGSIGVIALHEDWSEWLEKEGVAITEFSAGRFKTEGAPWKEMSEEGVAFMQQRVEEVYGWFIRDVARFRGVGEDAVRSGFGEGRVLPADAAVDARLADRRVDTLDDIIDELKDEDRDDRGARALADVTVETIRRRRSRGA